MDLSFRLIRIKSSLNRTVKPELDCQRVLHGVTQKNDDEAVLVLPFYPRDIELLRRLKSRRVIALYLGLGFVRKFAVEQVGAVHAYVDSKPCFCYCSRPGILFAVAPVKGMTTTRSKKRKAPRRIYWKLLNTTVGEPNG